MTSSWFFLSTLNYDARWTTHQTGYSYTWHDQQKANLINVAITNKRKLNGTITGKLQKHTDLKEELIRKWHLKRPAQYHQYYPQRLLSQTNYLKSYVYWTVNHLDSWIKVDQLDVTCFIISLFTAQHVSNFSTVIFRSLRLTVDLFHVLYCSGSMCVSVTLWFGWVVWYPYAGWSTRFWKIVAPPVYW